MPAADNMEHISDFLTTDYFADIRDFVPTSRDEYIAHLQMIYNLKLHTPFPLIVHLEPTNYCNQRCIMCCHPSMKRPPRMIDENIMLKAIGECASAPVWFVHFFFFGEPFLNTKTIEYMKIAKEKGVKNVSITSNFTVVTESMIRQLVDYEIDSLHISFNGVSNARYQAIHKTDSYRRVMKNIDYLLEYREKRAKAVPWISLTHVQTTESNGEMEAFKAHWLARVNNVHISPQFEYCNGSVHGEPRSEIRQTQEIANSGDILARNGGGARIACRQLWTRMVVLANGELVPCSQNIDGELSLGNLADMTIAEAWTGEKMAELRMQHICNNFPERHICRPCTDWDWSGRVDNRPRVKKVL